MALTKEVSALADSTVNKQEIYEAIMKELLENEVKIDVKDLESFCSHVARDMIDESSELQELCLNNILTVCEREKLRQLLPENSKETIMKNLITVLANSKEEKILTLCISFLNTNIDTIKLSDSLAGELLEKLSDIISSQSLSLTCYVSLCSYVQRFFKEYEANLLVLIPFIPKLIFLPLTHSSVKVREVAEKTLNAFPKLVLYSENEVFCNTLFKLVKEHYCKDLLELFKSKQEMYVLKLWKHVVNALGKKLHSNLPTMTPFFQIIERGFKSTSDDICKMAFLVWKCLISNFALDEAVLNDSKKLRFVLKPFKNISRSNENTSLAVCDTWWHLAWSLSLNLSPRFTEVCIPLLEFALGKTSNGSHEKTALKTNQSFLVKRGCHILLRFLELPPSTTLNRISSPKKLPPNLYPALQVPLDPKVIVRHFKEICTMIKIVMENLGNSKDMANHIECLMKSTLFVISTITEDRSKESVEAITSLISLVTDITDSQLCSSLLCLKCIDSLSKLPRSILTSHCFNGASRKSQDILCTTLLKLLLNPYLLTKDTPKRFLSAYNRLIQAGLVESLNPLLMAQRFNHCLKIAAIPGVMDSEVVFEMWSGIASPLLEIIEKTQEVNQGDKREHDFSCLYDVLLCPFEHIFPVAMHQFRNKPSFNLWANLYKIFIRCASLVPTSVPNEACEQFCCRFKVAVKDDLLKEPHYFETVCFLLETVIECIDASSVGINSSNVLSNIMTRKKPLGNLTSVIDLVSLLMKAFHDYYLSAEEDIYQSCTPKAQRKSQISKTATPIDLVKTLFTSGVVSGSMVSFVLEQLVEPITKVFLVSQKKSSSPAIGTKLEDLWNALTSFIEMHFMGPYDSDFLSTMRPLLEVTFLHSRRQLKDRSKRFWFATFAPVSSTLKYSESLKNVLKKAKVTLTSDLNVSALEEFTYTTGSGSLEESNVNFTDLTLKNAMLKQKKEPFETFEDKIPAAKERKSNNVDLKSSLNRQSMQLQPAETKPVNSNIDELPSSEFVNIDVSMSEFPTPKRRSIRKRKSFVPALYNDLSQSQDTNTLFGSSDSFDTASSSEIMIFKSQEETVKSSECEEKLEKEINENKTSKEKNQSEKIITSASKTEEESENSNEILVSNDNDVDNKESSASNKNISDPVKGQGIIIVSPSDKEIQSSLMITESDSDEIVPSSQSSVENESIKRFPTLENSVKNVAKVQSDNNSAKHINIASDDKFSVECIVEEVAVLSPCENDENNFVYECPETPIDIIENISKKSEAEIAKHEVLIVEDLMPLKSSENIQSSDDQNAKLLNPKTVWNNFDSAKDVCDTNIKITEINSINGDISFIQNNVSEILQTSDVKEASVVDEASKDKSNALIESSFKNDLADTSVMSATIKRRSSRRSLDLVGQRTTSKRTSSRKSLPGPVKKKPKQLPVTKFLSDIAEKVDLELNSKDTLDSIVHDDVASSKLSNEIQVDSIKDENPGSKSNSLNKNIGPIDVLNLQNESNNLKKCGNSPYVFTENKIITRSSQNTKSVKEKIKGDKRSSDDDTDLKSSSIPAITDKDTSGKEIDVLPSMIVDEVEKTLDFAFLVNAFPENKMITRSSQNTKSCKEKIKGNKRSPDDDTDSKSSSPPAIIDKEALVSGKEIDILPSMIVDEVEKSLDSISQVDETEESGVTDSCDSSSKKENASSHSAEKGIAQPNVSVKDSFFSLAENSDNQKPNKRTCRKPSRTKELKDSNNTENNLSSQFKDKQSFASGKNISPIIEETFTVVADHEKNEVKMPNSDIDQIETFAVNKLAEKNPVENNFIAIKESEVENSVLSNDQSLTNEESGNTQDSGNNFVEESLDHTFKCNNTFTKSELNQKELNAVEKVGVLSSDSAPDTETVSLESCTLRSDDSNCENQTTPEAFLEPQLNSLGVAETKLTDKSPSVFVVSLDCVVETREYEVTEEESADIFKEESGKSNTEDFLEEINLSTNAAEPDTPKPADTSDLCNSPSENEDILFSEDLDPQNKRNDMFEITEVVNTILNDSILKNSEESAPSLIVEERFSSNDEVKPLIEDILNQINSISPEKEQSYPHSYTNQEPLPDEVPLYNLLESPANSESHNIDTTGIPLIDDVTLTNEISCFAISTIEKKNLIDMDEHELDGTHDKSSTKRRKGKCPKRSSIKQKDQTDVLISKNDESLEKHVLSNSKLVISKLGKRSMQKDPQSHKEKKGSVLSMKQSEQEFSENMPANKRPKKCLISSQVLGKTGLEMKTNDPSVILIQNLKEMRYDELTDMNTRFNASSGTETRRFKMMAASQQSLDSKHGATLNLSIDENAVCLETYKPSSSILKKRKAHDDSTPVKLRKVTFAQPLVREKLFRSDDNICTRSPRSISEISEKTVKVETNNIPSSESKDSNQNTLSDSLSSSEEYQNSDNLSVYNANPVSPSLINCQDSIKCILKDLTSPAWIQALETLLLSKDIKTLGDLCKLNMHELKVLPFKSPKLKTLHKALLAHVTRTQETAEEKFNAESEDLSFCGHDSSVEPVTNKVDEVEMADESTGAGVLEEMAKELLKRDNIKQLSQNTLITLAKKCFDEVTGKLENA